jgi:hypothetical protein
LNRN